MRESKKVLIIGLDSKIGELAGRRFADYSYEIHGTTRRGENTAPNIQYLDLADDPAKWPRLPTCDIALICAAIASVAGCETQPEVSHRINVEATCRLSAQLMANDCLVLFPSTNLVFDGQESFVPPDKPVSQTTNYAKQKVVVENFLREQTGRSAIVRFTKVLDSQHELFVEWMWRLKLGENIRSYSNKLFSPISIDFAVDALVEVGRHKLDGMFQLSGSDDITYTEAARHFAKRLGADISLVDSSPEPEQTFLPRRHATLHQSEQFKSLGHPVEPFEVLDQIFGLDN